MNDVNMLLQRFNEMVELVGFGEFKNIKLKIRVSQRLAHLISIFCFTWKGAENTFTHRQFIENYIKIFNTSSDNSGNSLLPSSKKNQDPRI